MNENDNKASQFISSKSLNIFIIFFGICLIIFAIWQIMSVAGDVEYVREYYLKFMLS